MIDERIYQHVPAFLLVLTRIGGLFLAAPLLSGLSVPVRVKALLVLTLGLVVYPMVDPSSVIDARVDLWSVATMMVGELLIGGSIGLIASIPFATVQLSGTLMGQQMGLALANIINPAIDIEGDNVGQLLFIIAIFFFLLAGGVEALFTVLVGTFANVPLAGFSTSAAPMGLLSGMLDSSFDLALRIALPVLTIIFLENIAVGFIMKTVPSLNIMSFGFPIRILAGVFVLVGALGMMAHVIKGDIFETLMIVESWANSL